MVTWGFLRGAATQLGAEEHPGAFEWATAGEVGIWNDVSDFVDVLIGCWAVCVFFVVFNIVFIICR